MKLGKRLRRSAELDGSLRTPGLLAAGAGAVTVAATVAGLGIRALRARPARETAETLAAFTAASVANAARGHVIEAAVTSHGDDATGNIQSAARDTISQAAHAGADVVAAAIGAIQGARTAAREASVEYTAAVRAAVAGIREGARAISPAADARVVEALRHAEGIDARNIH